MGADRLALERQLIMTDFLSKPLQGPKRMRVNSMDTDTPSDVCESSP